jgi:methionyl-tRNA formyltransferase
MRVVYLGTPEFAVPPLERLLEAGYRVSLVVTQPDRPKGRGQQVAASPVKRCAERHGLAVFQPERIRRPECVERLREERADVMAVVGYGQIIPQAIIDLPRWGIINLHASLLPKYRGAAPIQWAVANGETVTGVTTMRIDAGLDTGDILLQTEVEIGPEETAAELSPRLARAGAELLIRTLAGLEAGAIEPRPQDHSQATLAPMLKKEDGRIAWSWPARAVHNRVRGMQPWPGAYTTFRGQTLHIWRTRLSEAAAPPGVLRKTGRALVAGCGGGGSVELLEVQLEGKKRMSGEAFANGQRLTQDEQLGA